MSKSLFPWRSPSSLLTSAPAKDPLFCWWGGRDVGDFCESISKTKHLLLTSYQHTLFQRSKETPYPDSRTATFPATLSPRRTATRTRHHGEPQTSQRYRIR